MIKNIVVDGSTSEDDYIKFMNQPKVNKKLTELLNHDDIYIIGLDIASENSKDFSCMSHYKEDKDGNMIFVGSELTENIKEG